MIPDPITIIIVIGLNTNGAFIHAEPLNIRAVIAQIIFLVLGVMFMRYQDTMGTNVSYKFSLSGGRAT